MLTIDSLAYASAFRNIHPGKKIAAAGILLLLAVSGQSVLPGLLLTGVMGAFTVWGGGTPGRLYLRLLKAPLLFIGLSLAAIVININVTAEHGLYLAVTAEGLQKGIRLACSAMGAVSCMYFLALSTPLTDIFYVLERLHCPYLMIELMLLIYRFVFLLWELADELTKAAEGRLGNRNLKISIRTSGQIFATLFVRAWKRSSAVYDAMESRGYDGELRVLPGFKKKQN